MISQTMAEQSKVFLKKRWTWIFLVIAVVMAIIPFRHLISRGFSDTDDFLELHRAIATDLPDPVSMLLTPHYTNRYRPVNRIMTAATTYLFGLNAQGFLFRNLLFHVLSVMAVFGIAVTLTDNPVVSLITSGLFALHPSNVNLVSIAIFTHTFGAFLILLVVYLLLRDRRTGDPLHLKVSHPWLSLVLLFITTLSTEMYLWVLPVFAGYMIWLFYKCPDRRYLVFASAAVLFVLIFLAVRHMIIDTNMYAVSSEGDTYGLRGIWHIALNFAMFLTAAGFSLDPLLFFNPVMQTLPIGTDMFRAPGLVISMVLSFILIFCTIFGAVAAIVPSRRNRNNIFALIFLGLFLLSISVIVVSAKASETYMYLPNAFMALTQGILLNELVKIFLANGSVFKNMSMIIIPCLVLLIVRFYGTDHRNQILADKAGRVKYMQTEVLRALKGGKEKNIIFASLCPFKEGYSVYGGQGIDILMGKGRALGRESKFVQLTTGNMKVEAKSMDLFEVIKDNFVHADIGTKVLFIDDAGSIYDDPNNNFKCL
jgi:hypothetical protein